MSNRNPYHSIIAYFSLFMLSVFSLNKVGYLLNLYPLIISEVVHLYLPIYMFLSCMKTINVQVILVCFPFFVYPVY